MTALAQLGKFGIFVGTFVRSMDPFAIPWRECVGESYRIGLRSLPILLIISTFVGTNLALQGYMAFKPLGGEQMVGMFIALAGVREMAPIMVAAMIASKAGTEMASHIAVMRIRDQIDALEVMAVNPHMYLITPRLIGILIVLPALTILSIADILVAAYMVSTIQLGLNGSVFIALATDSIGFTDLINCGIKSIFFGFIICFVSCYYGFNSKPGPAGVGQASNAAVVISACACAILNYLLSEMMYG